MSSSITTKITTGSPRYRPVQPKSKGKFSSIFDEPWMKQFIQSWIEKCNKT